MASLTCDLIAWCVHQEHQTENPWLSQRIHPILASALDLTYSKCCSSICLLTPSGPGLATHMNRFHGTSSLAFISDTIMWFSGHLSNNKSNYVSLRSSPWVHHFISTETVFPLYHFASFCNYGEESDFNLGVCTLVGILCPFEWAYT